MREKVDIQPVMNLIASTIAPGTWDMEGELQAIAWVGSRTRWCRFI